MSVSDSPPSSPQCPFAGWVAEYYAGALDERQCAELERHMDQCPACADAADTLTELSDATICTVSALAGTQDDEPEYLQLEEQLLLLSDDHSRWPSPPRRANPPVGALPCTFGNYELQACIGRGAWGAVYRARHTQLDLPVAVKVLDAARLPDAAAIENFLREAQAAGRLRHPGIVRATDAGQHEGLHYLAMDLVDGVDAGQLLKAHGPLRMADACEIVRQAALALDCAHSQGWVHRDVKPSNLIVAGDGAVKLLDLGIAGQQQSQPHASDESRPLGTADYMAPEQWTDFHSVDGRADVYSLGCTLWKLLVGRLPPRGESTSLCETRPEIPRRLERFVMQMLAAMAAQRVESAAQVATRLKRFARTADLAALVQRVRQTEDDGGSAATACEDQRVSAATQMTRRRAAVVAGGMGIAAALAPWLLSARSPRLQRANWRSLRPETGPWLALASDAEVQVDALAGNGVQLSSPELTLASCGRVVAAPFRVRLQMQQADWQGASGLFVGGREAGEEGQREFHLIEVRPPDGDADPATRRLLWSAWRMASDEGDSDAQRIPLAETQIQLAGGAEPQRLEVTFHDDAFPVVRFNDDLLPESRWTLSAAGRRFVSRELRAGAGCWLGKLGVAVAGGTCQFTQIQLAYL